jgi:hypothetical protein
MTRPISTNTRSNRNSATAVSSRLTKINLRNSLQVAKPLKSRVITGTTRSVGIARTSAASKFSCAHALRPPLGDIARSKSRIEYRRASVTRLNAGRLARSGSMRGGCGGVGRHALRKAIRIRPESPGPEKELFVGPSGSSLLRIMIPTCFLSGSGANANAQNQRAPDRNHKHHDSSFQVVCLFLCCLPLACLLGSLYFSVPCALLLGR